MIDPCIEEIVQSLPGSYRRRVSYGHHVTVIKGITTAALVIKIYPEKRFIYLRTGLLEPHIKRVDITDVKGTVKSIREMALADMCIMMPGLRNRKPKIKID